MSSLRVMSVDIKLTDIWCECQRELIAMREEINHLKDCLKTCKLIAEYTKKCNETLVSIIETCRLDPLGNKEVVHLVGRLRVDEQCIDKQRDHLTALEAKDQFNGDNCLHLISDWNRLNRVKTSTEEKCTQTVDIEESPTVVDEDLNMNDIVANDVKTETTLACDEESNETIKNGNSGQISDACNEDTRIVAIDINDTQSDDKSENSFNVCDMDAINDSDCTQSDDKSVKSEDLGCVDDSEDSDYGVKRRSQRKRKTPNRSQVLTEVPKSERQKRIDDLVLHLKVGDQYVCDQIGCDYKSGVKRRIYSHMSEHNPNPRRIRSTFKVNREEVEKPKTIRQKRINELVFHCKVDDKYVCDVEDCNFNTGVKREMYRHKIDHKADDDEDMNPFDEQKLEERKRIILLMKDFKVDDQYVCKATGCDFTSKNEMQFYYHQRRHQSVSRGPRGNHADWLTRIKGTGVDAEGNYVCSRPNCVFAAKEKEEFFDHFKQHMNALTVENGSISGPLYPCDYPKCPKTVSTVINFYQHERYIHPKQRVPCDWPGCEGLFKNYKYVNKHKNALHLRTKRYPCEWPGCGHAAKTAHSLKNHRVVHTKARSLKCDWPGCEYSAGVSWALVAHKRIHTGEKPYACDWPDCAYRCSQPCTLISHKRKHTGEKPYLCMEKDCGKRFASLAGIHTHRKTHNRSQLTLNKKQKQSFI